MATCQIVVFAYLHKFYVVGRDLQKRNRFCKNFVKISAIVAIAIKENFKFSHYKSYGMCLKACRGLVGGGGHTLFVSYLRVKKSYETGSGVGRDCKTFW